MNLQQYVMGAALALTVGACAPAQQATSSVQSRSATLTVMNNNWLEMAVYMVRGPMRTRIGTVGSMSRSQFAIPAAYVIGVSDITIQADPVGSRESYVSPPIQVFPGAAVELTLANRLSLSHFAVYARH